MVGYNDPYNRKITAKAMMEIARKGAMIDRLNGSGKGDEDDEDSDSAYEDDEDYLTGGAATMAAQLFKQQDKNLQEQVERTIEPEGVLEKRMKYDLGAGKYASGGASARERMDLNLGAGVLDDIGTVAKYTTNPFAALMGRGGDEVHDAAVRFIGSGKCGGKGDLTKFLRTNMGHGTKKNATKVSAMLWKMMKKGKGYSGGAIDQSKFPGMGSNKIGMPDLSKYPEWAHKGKKARPEIPVVPKEPMAGGVRTRSGVTTTPAPPARAVEAAIEPVVSRMEAAIDRLASRGSTRRRRQRLAPRPLSRCGNAGLNLANCRWNNGSGMSGGYGPSARREESRYGYDANEQADGLMPPPTVKGGRRYCTQEHDPVYDEQTGKEYSNKCKALNAGVPSSRIKKGMQGKGEFNADFHKLIPKDNLPSNIGGTRYPDYANFEGPLKGPKRQPQKKIIGMPNPFTPPPDWQGAVPTSDLIAMGQGRFSRDGDYIGDSTGAIIPALQSKDSTVGSGKRKMKGGLDWSDVGDVAKKALPYAAGLATAAIGAKVAHSAYKKNAKAKEADRQLAAANKQISDIVASRPQDVPQKSAWAKTADTAKAARASEAAMAQQFQKDVAATPHQKYREYTIRPKEPTIYNEKFNFKKVKPASSGKGKNARAAIVKKVMSERGLSMIEASKYVKAHGLY